jgi:hypothetical protein
VLLHAALTIESLNLLFFHEGLELVGTIRFRHVEGLN